MHARTQTTHTHTHTHNTQHIHTHAQTLTWAISLVVQVQTAPVRQNDGRVVDLCRHPASALVVQRQPDVVSALEREQVATECTTSTQGALEIRKAPLKFRCFQHTQHDRRRSAAQRTAKCSAAYKRLRGAPSTMPAELLAGPPLPPTEPTCLRSHHGKVLRIHKYASFRKLAPCSVRMAAAEAHDAQKT